MGLGDRGYVVYPLDAAGLQTYRIGVGDASLYPGLLEGLGVPDTARERILTELVDGDFVGEFSEAEYSVAPQSLRVVS